MWWWLRGGRIQLWEAGWVLMLNQPAASFLQRLCSCGQSWQSRCKNSWLKSLSYWSSIANFVRGRASQYINWYMEFWLPWICYLPNIHQGLHSSIQFFLGIFCWQSCTFYGHKYICGYELFLRQIWAQTQLHLPTKFKIKKYSKLKARQSGSLSNVLNLKLCPQTQIRLIETFHISHVLRYFTWISN